MIRLILLFITIYLINTISRLYFGDTFAVGYYTFLFSIVLYMLFNVKVIVEKKE